MQVTIGINEGRSRGGSEVRCILAANFRTEPHEHYCMPSKKHAMAAGRELNLTAP
jgi:hypothetical protein